jgi:hypothetical protein
VFGAFGRNEGAGGSRKGVALTGEVRGRKASAAPAGAQVNPGGRRRKQAGDKRLCDDIGVGLDWELERVKGIEPSYSAWKAAALPLSYTRDFKDLMNIEGIDIPLFHSQTSDPPIERSAHLTQSQKKVTPAFRGKGYNFHSNSRGAPQARRGRAFAQAHRGRPGAVPNAR